MTNHTENQKRIAKNTLMLYTRMFILMCISLFTSRVNLQLLGITDFGIYNAVGGLVGMFAIISGSMTVAISRYITYELGTGDTKRLNDIFCTSINIQLLMSVVIVLIGETAGIWFINNKMVIPVDRLFASHWIFQFSIVSFIIGLISVPYNALIISHERMSAFAYISILEALLRLAVCFCLYITPFDKLITWVALLMIVQILLQMIYVSYCRHHFQESRYHYVYDRPLLKNMGKFIGWAAFGNGVVVLKDQGSNVLLNMFCGPVVNAARGVAMQVNGVICQLVSNMMMAINPQITKSYSSGNSENMHSLIIRGGKFSFMLLALVFFPLWPNIDVVLSIWLVSVPEYSASFVMLILAYSMLDCFTAPLVTGVLAEGSIKRYEIDITFIYLINITASYLLLKIGYAPQCVFIMNILFKGFVLIALLLQSRRRYDFPIKRFIFKSILPSAAVFIVCTVFVKVLKLPIENTVLHFLASVTAIFIFTLFIIYFIGLSKQEASFLRNQIKNKITRK